MYLITYNCNVNMLIDLPNKRVSDWVYLKSLSQLWDTLRDNGLFSQVKSCSQLQNVGHLAEWGCLSVYWPVGLTNHSTQKEERWWYSFLCGLLQKWKMIPYMQSSRCKILQHDRSGQRLLAGSDGRIVHDSTWPLWIPGDGIWSL